MSTNENKYFEMHTLRRFVTVLSFLVLGALICIQHNDYTLELIKENDALRANVNLLLKNMDASLICLPRENGAVVIVKNVEGIFSCEKHLKHEFGADKKVPVTRS